MDLIKKEWLFILKEWDFLVHHTKKKVLYKFLVLFLILLCYFSYVVWKFGAAEGMFVTLLTWSFFVLCTPVADAGILIDFPTRLLFNVRMVWVEVFVWVFAVSINIFALLFVPGSYNDTLLINLLHYVITHPFYWFIVLLSALGTFFSIVFADELVDVAEEHHRHVHKKHSSKLKFILMIFLILLVLILYDFLLKSLGISIPLI